MAYYAAEQLEDVDAADFTYKQYGDTMLLAGIDTEKGAQLYHIDATSQFIYLILLSLFYFEFFRPLQTGQYNFNW